MASSTSSSLAGAESTPSAQVSAAPPPYLWLPSRRGRAGSPGLGVGVPGAVRRRGLPGRLPSWGVPGGAGKASGGGPDGCGSRGSGCAGPELLPRGRGVSWCSAPAREHPEEGAKRAQGSGASASKHLFLRNARPRAWDALTFSGFPSLGFCVLGSRRQLRARLNPS